MFATVRYGELFQRTLSQLATKGELRRVVRYGSLWFATTNYAGSAYVATAFATANAADLQKTLPETTVDLQPTRKKCIGPIPKKWRGVCAGGGNFSCNNKIIGARWYPGGSDGESARDHFGHGTHVASTVGGRRIKGVSYHGLAKGTIRGGVPSSRIAIYKVCNPKCRDDNILAAFDDAIADGVDIISISIGSKNVVEILKNSLAIGSFHAMEKGILTVQSAGNYGPNPSTTSSVAPWLLSVAATTIDRQFIDKLILGNGKTFIGKSINIVPSNGTKFPIVACNATACHGNYISPEKCSCIDKNLIKGNIVLSGEPGGEELAYQYGAIGSVVNFTYDVSIITYRPSLNLDSKDFDLVQSYTYSTKYPLAEILKSDVVQDTSAPKVASFSSRGPNPIIPEIMKPDIGAPGVNILAAYSPNGPNLGAGIYNAREKYTILDGTSMACPHAAGVAAYVKSFHSDWSLAAIKSAIMTTAKPVNGTYNDMIGEFAYGSGNINPQQALHPGLIYDITKQDYMQMLCNFGYNDTKVEQISGEKSSCKGVSNRHLVKDINYPALVILVRPHKRFSAKIHRTVTNVGSPNSSYTATIIPIPKIKIKVVPKFLTFKSLHEKQSFVVIVTGGAKSNQTMFSSSLVWSDGTHNVKSPIIIQKLSFFFDNIQKLS
ncbi:subtilisin-like serine protease [Trifolium pratense]|uniref:Subtilisin-like serine protease n=1 Tax=Trifolium pratense TaxID=57577 RepID=A0A2K3MQN5_TRIPR|nr:subtilisin-like serine protease [Trifolium pratense]